MSILDDAIREHLELKRSHGAGESELQQLEDEAFGLPTRPGEPDFPERPGDGGEPVEPGAQGPTTAEAPPPAEVEVPQVQAEQAAIEHPVVEPQAGEPSEAEASPTEESIEPERVEPADEAPAPQAADAPAAEESEPTAFYDHSEKLDLGDLDLELEEEIDEGLEEIGAKEAAEGEEAAEDAEPPAAEALDVDTVEHEPPPPPEEEIGPPADEPPAGEEASDKEDVLEETPEFLQDRPEDDELWFEQGKPKDFDF